MKTALVIFLLVFVMQLISNYVLEALGVEQWVYHALSAGIAGGLAAFISQKIGRAAVKRS